MTGLLREIVDVWTKQHQQGAKWLHPADEDLLEKRRHPFTLDYPAVPFIGDILDAPVVVLGANAGYGGETPIPFEGEGAVRSCLQQIASGSTIAWAKRVPYYMGANYRSSLLHGHVAVINACAYRSPGVPPAGLVEELPSARLTRKWLLDALLPLVRTEQRLVVAWRPRLWACAADLSALNGYGVVYTNARSKHLRSDVLAEAERFCRITR